jgi:hypothetical protein
MSTFEEKLPTDEQKNHVFKIDNKLMLFLGKQQDDIYKFQVNFTKDDLIKKMNGQFENFGDGSSLKGGRRHKHKKRTHKRRSHKRKY